MYRKTVSYKGPVFNQEKSVVYVGLCLTYHTGFSVVLLGAKELSQGTLPGMEALYSMCI